MVETLRKRHESPPTPSPLLLSAALSGLLSTVAACEASSDPHPLPDGGMPRITASRVVAGLTIEQFKKDCDGRHGKLEQHSHCGGFNTCSGFSYDAGTSVLTEHTCRGLNTCAGYSCVVPREATHG